MQASLTLWEGPSLPAGFAYVAPYEATSESVFCNAMLSSVAATVPWLSLRTSAGSLAPATPAVPNPSAHALAPTPDVTGAASSTVSSPGATPFSFTSSGTHLEHPLAPWLIATLATAVP